ncbi:hypothetical protein NQH47_20305 [Burkholderia pseudomallei]|uniref:hypothetical protein n=1 Tax=Burkholderia pseudomallei TaxID=28450 RepID=UPI002115FA9C|nr:hypothetical protein [Burkholderia pseudomallei]MCQ8223575.1 hypothetical protein [Burkholderia pseudomallei]
MVVFFSLAARNAAAAAVGWLARQPHAQAVGVALDCLLDITRQLVGRLVRLKRQRLQAVMNERGVRAGKV